MKQHIGFFAGKEEFWGFRGEFDQMSMLVGLRTVNIRGATSVDTKAK